MASKLLDLLRLPTGSFSVGVLRESPQAPLWERAEKRLFSPWLNRTVGQMTLEKIKAEIRTLTPKDRGALLRFLNCLEVTDDPEWQRIVREAAERRHATARVRKPAARRNKARPTAA